MKKILICSGLLLTGCPMAVDISAGWGSDQSIEKTVKIKQKQTTAQTDSQTSFWEEFFNVLPLFAGPAPTPTPTPTPTPQIPVVKSITIEVGPTPGPTPHTVIHVVSRKPRALPPCKH